MKFKKVAAALAAILSVSTVMACTQTQSMRAEELIVMEEKIQVANDMVDAWNTKDWDRVIDLFAEDGVLHSMMVEPIEGREAIGARIRHMAEGVEWMLIDIRNMGVVGDVVMMERVDRFTYYGNKGSVPVVGVLVVKNGKVQEWRDYYDRAQLLSEMGVETDFDKEAR